MMVKKICQYVLGLRKHVSFWNLVSMLSFKTVDKYNNSLQKIASMPLLHLTNYATLLFHTNRNKYLGLSAQIATYQIILKLEKSQNMTLLKAVVK